jgi:hypothetical protein
MPVSGQPQSNNSDASEPKLRVSFRLPSATPQAHNDAENRGDVNA